MNKMLVLGISTVALLSGAYFAHADDIFNACLETFCPDGCYADSDGKAHCCSLQHKCASDSYCPEEKYCEPENKYCAKCPEFRGAGALCMDGHCSCQEGLSCVSNICKCPAGSYYEDTGCVCKDGQDMCNGQCCSSTQECHGNTCVDKVKTCSFGGQMYAEGAKVGDCGKCSNGTVVQDTGITVPTCKVCSTTNWAFSNATDGITCGVNKQCQNGDCKNVSVLSTYTHGRIGCHYGCNSFIDLSDINGNPRADVCPSGYHWATKEEFDAIRSAGIFPAHGNGIAYWFKSCYNDNCQTGDAWAIYGNGSIYYNARNYNGESFALCVK